MKLRRLAVGSIVLGALATSVLPASGAESGTVNAKVTIAAPCLTVGVVSLTGATVLDMGTQQLGLGSSFANFMSLTNCSTTAENISARGTNATSTTSAATWALHDTFQLGSPRCPSAPDVYGLNTS